MALSTPGAASRTQVSILEARRVHVSKRNTFRPHPSVRTCTCNGSSGNGCALSNVASVHRVQDREMADLGSMRSRPRRTRSRSAPSARRWLRAAAPTSQAQLGPWLADAPVPHITHARSH
eukprot:2654592-Rhodomonas_salina.1